MERNKYTDYLDKVFVATCGKEPTQENRDATLAEAYELVDSIASLLSTVCEEKRIPKFMLTQLLVKMGIDFSSRLDFTKDISMEDHYKLLCAIVSEAVVLSLEQVGEDRATTH